MNEYTWTNSWKAINRKDCKWALTFAILKFAESAWLVFATFLWNVPTTFPGGLYLKTTCNLVYHIGCVLEDDSRSKSYLDLSILSLGCSYSQFFCSFPNHLCEMPRFLNVSTSTLGRWALGIVLVLVLRALLVHSIQGFWRITLSKVKIIGFGMAE